jgi:hypothetical protein
MTPTGVRSDPASCAVLLSKPVKLRSPESSLPSALPDGACSAGRGRDSADDIARFATSVPASCVRRRMVVDMPRRSNDYQRVVFYIQKYLAPGARVTESALLPDRRTGHLREVDVLVEGTLGGYPIAVAIEVRSQKRKADVQWIEQVRSKFESLPVNQVVLVSRSGFTADARQKAADWGIEIHTPAEALSPTGPLATLAGVEITTLRWHPRRLADGLAWIPGWEDPVKVESNTALYAPDGSEALSVGRLTWEAFLQNLRNVDPHALEDLRGDLGFQIDLRRPLPSLRLGTSTESFEPMLRVMPTGELVQIERIQVNWEAEVETEPLDLIYSAFRGAPFAFGKVTDDGAQERLVIVHHAPPVVSPPLPM